MKREILFRGKRDDNGEWVQGFYVGASENAPYHEIFVPNDAYHMPWERRVVDPATVGQYTGLTDRNGVKIFEGDILRYVDGTLHEVVFERRNGSAYFGWVIDRNETWHFDYDFLRKLEVIGNIHDNRELLEVQP